jgi:hypothetical protein
VIGKKIGEVGSGTRRKAVVENRENGKSEKQEAWTGTGIKAANCRTAERGRADGNG